MRLMSSAFPIMAAALLAAAASVPAAAGDNSRLLARGAGLHMLDAIAAPQGARRALPGGHRAGVHRIERRPMAARRHLAPRRLQRHHGVGAVRWWGQPPYVLHQPPRHRPPVAFRYAPPKSPPARHHALRLAPKRPGAIVRHFDRQHRLDLPPLRRHRLRAKRPPQFLVLDSYNATVVRVLRRR